MPSCATWQPAGRTRWSRTTRITRRAGRLLPGDIIVALAEQPVCNAVAGEQILSRLRSHHPVPARIYRNGRTYEHMIDL
jgi:type II secretory pathway component PulC